MFDSGSALAFLRSGVDLRRQLVKSRYKRIEAWQRIVILWQSIENVAHVKDVILNHDS